VGQERLRLAQVEHRRAELPQRPEDSLPGVNRPRPAQDHGHDQLTAEIRRHERNRRRLAVDHDRHQLVRRLRYPVAVEAQNLRRLAHRPEDRPCQHGRADRVEAELELGDDAEVAAAAAQAPEQVLILGLACPHELAIGGHEVDRLQLVDREPVLAHQPPDAAAEREPGDSGVGDDPGWGGQPERLRLPIELAEKNTRLRSRRARLRIDPDALHRRQVEDDAALANRQTREAVPATPDGDREAGRSGEPHRGDHVGRAGAARDERGEAIYRSVPDLALLVVGRIPGSNELSAKGTLEFAQSRLIEPGLGGDGAHGVVVLWSESCGSQHVRRRRGADPSR
jgi:hypothetical protein